MLETYRQRLMDKLALQSRAELVQYRFLLRNLVVRELKHEIEAYQDFCSHRERLSNKGDGNAVSREGWLNDRRKELQARMRRRRMRVPRLLR